MPKSSDTENHPRYKRLAEALMAQIRSGAMRVGTSLPGELELVSQHRVSRHTVREALRMLTDLGLIERRQGVGTVVRARQTNESYSHTVRSPSELLHYPTDSRLQVVQVEPVRASRKLARDLGCKTGAAWVRIGAVRRVKSARVPICWTDIYVLPEYAGVAELIGKRSQPVYELIEQKYGEKVATVQVDVRASLLHESIAEGLQVAPQSPSLLVVRRYVGQSRRVFEISMSQHPAERYSFSMELRRGWKADGGWAAS